MVLFTQSNHNISLLHHLMNWCIPRSLVYPSLCVLLDLDLNHPSRSLSSLADWYWQLTDSSPVLTSEKRHLVLFCSVQRRLLRFCGDIDNQQRT